MLMAGRLMPSPTQPTSGGAALRVNHSVNLLSEHIRLRLQVPSLCFLHRKVSRCHVIFHATCTLLRSMPDTAVLLCQITAEATHNTAASIPQLAIQQVLEQVLERHVPLPGAL